jgi:predicted adenine nucleotide alpha hydrolase (AANH) superfamily ATPase
MQILLHACCAPCSAAIVEHLLNNDYQPVIFYYNPNIYPYQEYEKRKSESERHAKLLGIEFIDADYEHDTWLNAVRGLENEPERGNRCLACFRLRLSISAKYAAEHGFYSFATTLASSRWKNLSQIEQAGNDAASLFKGLTFIANNWRKGGLTERRNELIRRYGFYNQLFCGCEFSHRQLK